MFIHLSLYSDVYLQEKGSKSVKSWGYADLDKVGIIFKDIQWYYVKKQEFACGWLEW